MWGTIKRKVARVRSSEQGTRGGPPPKGIHQTPTASHGATSVTQKERERPLGFLPYSLLLVLLPASGHERTCNFRPQPRTRRPTRSSWDPSNRGLPAARGARAGREAGRTSQPRSSHHTKSPAHHLQLVVLTSHPLNKLFKF